MKKRILQLSMLSIFLFCSIFLFNLVQVKAQVYEFLPVCDFNDDLSITELDLMTLQAYIDDDVECSTSTVEVCVCDIDGDRDCDRRDYRACDASLGASLEPNYYPGGIDYPGTKISIHSSLTVNINSYYNIANYDLNDDGVINILESSYFENFYKGYKRLYSQRKRLGTTTDEYHNIDINDDGIVNSRDKKIVYSFRKYLKKAYSNKVVTEELLRDRIAENVLDLNNDGAVNKLDSRMLKNPYKVVRYRMRGKEVSVSNLFNYDFNNDEMIDGNDYAFLKALKKKISKYRHIYNYHSDRVKIAIADDNFDINGDGVVNYTDREIVKDFTKKQRKMRRYSPADTEEWNADFDLNNDGVVDTSDTTLMKRYYVKAKAHYRYGKTVLTYVDEAVDDLANDDTVAPIIVIAGSVLVSINQNDTYVDAGVLMAMDDVDGDLTAQVVTNNPVDTSTPGVYIVTYTVSDSSGNEGSAIREVIVNETGTN